MCKVHVCACIASDITGALQYVQDINNNIVYMSTIKDVYNIGTQDLVLKKGTH